MTTQGFIPKLDFSKAFTRDLEQYLYAISIQWDMKYHPHTQTHLFPVFQLEQRP